MWHPTRNGRALEPRIGSNCKGWWQCTKKCSETQQPHVWRSTRHVKDKLGCLICANLVVCPCGCNSLEAQHPNIAAMWDSHKATTRTVAVNDTRRFRWRGIACQQPVSFTATIRMMLNHRHQKAYRRFAEFNNVYRKQMALLGIRECHGDWIV